MFSHKLNVSDLIGLGLELKKIIQVFDFIDGREGICVQLEHPCEWIAEELTFVERLTFLIYIS